ncbi:hypothetical protein [Gorillibacterium sp. sgz5001074]|uniref:hypothetical protein n=1 Tax=Gorillibacterium sp. sgz5001074 TaxID=3446695 RepID=UPI003F668972
MNLTIHYVPLTDTGLFRALYRLKSRHGLHHPIRLSIDTLGNQMVESALEKA